MAIWRAPISLSSQNGSPVNGREALTSPMITKASPLRADSHLAASSDPAGSVTTPYLAASVQLTTRCGGFCSGFAEIQVVRA